MTDPTGRQLGAGGLHLSSRTGTVQSRGTTGLSSAQRLVVLNEEALRHLASEARIQESKKGKMDEIIEKQVNDFLDSLDKKTKAQLSKTQLIKSVQKVYKWRKELRHRKSSSVVKSIPREYLDADLDPGAYREKHFKAILARGGPLMGNGSSSGSPGSPPSSLNASGSSLPPPNAFSAGVEKTERPLDGEHFENFILPTCPSRERETAISAKRAMQMKDWLARRANFQMERDRIKKWLATMSKKDDLSQEELLRIYQRKRKELSLEQIKDILAMPDSSFLTVNQLLAEYRSQVSPTGEDDSDDDDSDEDDDDDDDDDDDEMQGILPARNASAAIQLSSRAAVGNSTPHFGAPGPASHYYK